MKKTLLFLGFFLTFAFLYAQNNFPDLSEDKDATLVKLNREVASKGRGYVLWDNSNIVNDFGNYGQFTAWWTDDDKGRIVADDFDAEAGWQIERIVTRGFWNANSNPGPHFLGAKIFTDNGGEPGVEIFSYDNFPVTNQGNNIYYLDLPTPLIISEAGKYWVSAYGVYNTPIPGSGQSTYYSYYVYYGNNVITLKMKAKDTSGLFASDTNWNDIAAGSGGVPNSMYFIIEGDPGIIMDCDTVTNLKAKYDIDCSKAELTWNAPGEGEFTYIIYRDNEEIATVETESYTDITFEPTLAHAWGVKVECGDGTTLIARTTLPACKQPDCPDRPRNLIVDLDCEKNSAKLKWNEPATEILWDNTQTTTSGYLSYRCMLEVYSRVQIMADDFIVPTGETWYIKEIYSGGFHNASSGSYEKPDYIGIEIYEDSGAGIPGTKIYENTQLLFTTGSMNTQAYLILPEPVVLSAPGKYWVSVYGVYESLDADRIRFYVYTFPEEIESSMCFWSEENGEGAWDPHAGYSMYFRIHGDLTTATRAYNIYRDGLPIAMGVTDLFYEDTEFSLYSAHTWAVKYACPGGGESAPVFLSFPKCKEGPDPGVMENETTSFTIAPNPSSTQITITLENNAVINSIEVVNFLGQTVVSKTNLNKMDTTLDVSNLNNGIYFVRVVSNNGSSVQKFVKQ